MTSAALVFLAAHLLADFPLQTDDMAARKFDDWKARLAHSNVHVGLYLPAAWIVYQEPWSAVVFAALAGWLHFLVDTRRWAEPKDGAEWYPIVVDQTLHVTSLALVAVVVGWSV